MVSFSAFMVLGLVLFSIGIFGVLIRRNLLVVLMCIELMFNAVNLMLVAFSAYYESLAPQILVLFIMVVAASEVAIGLALITMLYQRFSTVDVTIISRLKG